jgi:hypothetical protein
MNNENQSDSRRQYKKKKKSDNCALCESAFALPLTPFDVDVVRSLAQINQRLETHSQS